MSSTIFSVKEHVLPASYIRTFPLSTRDAKDVRLQLAVKQYTPWDNRHPHPGDVTLIGAHANGFPKELYEPLWDELYHALKQKNVRIRSIWIADIASQGYSSVLNEATLGLDPNWDDHARDLFLLINHFHDSMPRPLIGVGHSMGGNQLVQLSLMHPRLFHSLILIDPMFHRALVPGPNPARASVSRREVWPSRDAARTAFLRSKFYQAWDTRVLDRWVAHGLRDLPTALFPLDPATGRTPKEKDADVLPATTAEIAAEPSPAVTLTTTKHSEIASFLRPNLDPAAANRDTHPDLDWAAEHSSQPLYRQEVMTTFTRLPHVRPSVLYIFGAKSFVSTPELRDDKVSTTGTGQGGSGGVTEGRVKEVLVDVGHLVPMEDVKGTADPAADWIGQELRRWQVGEERVARELAALGPPQDRLRPEVVRALGGDPKL